MKASLSVLLMLAIVLIGSCAQPGAPGGGPGLPRVGSTSVFARGFRTPTGITFVGGYMYVVNRGDGSIDKVSPQGDEEPFVDLDTAEAFSIVPTLHEDGLYVAAKEVVYLVSLDGESTVVADGFTSAVGLALDQAGNIFVTDPTENRVWRISPDGNREIFIDNDLETLLPNQWYSMGISFSPDYQWLYVVNMYMGLVTKYPILANGSPGEGAVVYQGDGEPNHMTIDAQGNLYITLYRDNAVMKISPENEHEVFSSNNLFNPTGIALGGEGFDKYSLYVSSVGLRTVTKIYIGFVN